jgi:hypothetical protein
VSGRNERYGHVGTWHPLDASTIRFGAFRLEV